MRNARTILNKFLNNLIPYVYLEFRVLESLHIYFPSDAFRVLEENLLLGNIYFNTRSIHSADTIIDLGAHAGSFTIYAILHSKPKTRIIAVEPSEKNYKLLLANLKLLKRFIKQKELEVLVLKKAVWTRHGQFKFYDTGWSEGGYIYEARQPSRGTYVETVTLDDVITLGKGRTIMKIDIEGAEVPVLLASKKLYKVAELAIEPHGGEDLLVKILRLHGYDCKVTIYKLNPQLFKEWLKVRPKIYGLTIAIYRLLALSVFHSTITLIKATKRI